MKSRRLTETDIAYLAFKPVATKVLRLTSLERPKSIPGSYEPFRRSNGDAVNLQLPLLPAKQEATSLDALESIVAKACKGDADLLAMNLPIARATHKFASENEIVAFKEDIRPLVLPYGHRYEFGMPLLMEYPNGSISAIFPDLRRTDALSDVGKRVVFSLMHHRWRENNPDLAGIDLQIWRYRNREDREILCIQSTDYELISYDTLMADIKQTYAIWHEVLQGAAAGRRRTGGTSGPLFGQL
jgi:hypothetical protein